jgi:ferredoxin
MAIGQGRLAAEQAHARLRGLPPPTAPAVEPITKDRIRFDYYAATERTESPRRPLEEWLIRPDEEIAATIGGDDFLREVGRCFSCGQCFGCQHCAMYCNPRGYTRVIEPHPGGYFALALDRCEGCGKCIELCPCGFLSIPTSEPQDR